MWTASRTSITKICWPNSRQITTPCSAPFPTCRSTLLPPSPQQPQCECKPGRQCHIDRTIGRRILLHLWTLSCRHRCRCNLSLSALSKSFILHFKATTRRVSHLLSLIWPTLLGTTERLQLCFGLETWQPQTEL